MLKQQLITRFNDRVRTQRLRATLQGVEDTESVLEDLHVLTFEADGHHHESRYTVYRLTFRLPDGSTEQIDASLSFSGYWPSRRYEVTYTPEGFEVETMFIDPATFRLKQLLEQIDYRDLLVGEWYHDYYAFEMEEAQHLVDGMMPSLVAAMPGLESVKPTGSGFVTLHFESGLRLPSIDVDDLSNQIQRMKSDREGSHT